MLNRTVTVRFPGLTVRCAVSATLLRTVTRTVIQEPAALSDPDRGDTVTFPFGLVMTKLTGPPTALTMNVPLAGLPLTADSTSSLGVTSRVPGVGGGDDEGDGEGDGDGDGDGDRDGDGDGDRDGDRDGGEDRVGADDRGASADVLWPAVGPSAGDVVLLGEPDAGMGVRFGEDGPPAWLDAAIGTADVPKAPPPRATVEA